MENKEEWEQVGEEDGEIVVDLLEEFDDRLLFLRFHRFRLPELRIVVRGLQVAMVRSEGSFCLLASAFGFQAFLLLAFPLCIECVEVGNEFVVAGVEVEPIHHSLEELVVVLVVEARVVCDEVDHLLHSRHVVGYPLGVLRRGKSVLVAHVQHDVRLSDPLYPDPRRAVRAVLALVESRVEALVVVLLELLVSDQLCKVENLPGRGCVLLLLTGDGDLVWLEPHHAPTEEGLS